jgi:predicted phosphodiesterase
MKKNQHKIIVLGDTHGRDKWEQIVKQPSDKVIFLGDYFDSFDIPFDIQMANFKKIIDYKQKNPKKVVLLLGNHDYHYLSYVHESYSGFQAGKKPFISIVVENAIEDGLIQVCYIYKDWAFTHAGITNTWFKNNCDEKEKIDDAINNTFLNHPSAFKFTEGINHSNYGDDITQSPLWVRPKSLGEDKLPGVKQVVGHTHQKHILDYDDMIFVDTLEFENEYLIIKNNVPEIGQI